MKKIFFISLIIILFSCSDKKSNYPWSELTFDEVLSLKSDKIIFLDFYSDNWGACKRLEVETLNDSRVIDFTNQYLIPLKFDAWYDSTGQELFKKFNGYAIPLLVFLDGEGEELDRVVGYQDADDFLLTLNNVLNNQDTFISLFKKYNQGNRSVDLIDKLSIKSEERQDNEFSSELYQFVLDRVSEFDTEVYQRAKFYFAKQALKNDDTSKIKLFISNYNESNKLGPAYMELIRFYASKKDTLKEVETYKNMINSFIDSDIISISRKSSLLNSYAWRMGELELNLEDALSKSIKSIQMVDSLGDKAISSKPMLLDTKAEILWKMNEIDEAIIIIDKAIEMDPKSQYYKDQKIKFKNSKKGN